MIGAMSATEHLTVGQAIVKYLSVQYSERDGRRRRLVPAIFGIFGHGNVAGLGQALESIGADLPLYQSRNEQSMVHTASGYAKAARRTATLACTSSIGPGATNMVTGAATATINRLPVLLLPSDYYVTRHQGNVLQELEHPLEADVSVNDCFRPVSRFFDRISRPEQLLTALPEAMRVLTDPADTGAVTIAIPQDVQAHAYRFPSRLFRERTWRIERTPPPAARIAEAARLIERSRRPMIIAGGGVHYAEAWDALGELAALGIPVSETFGGKGCYRGPRDWSLGGHGVEGTTAAARAAEQADLVIAVGARLGDFATASNSLFRHPGVRFLNLNVNARDAFKNGALPVVGDARESLTALAAACRERGVDFTGRRRAEVARLQAEWEEVKATDAYAPQAGQAMGEGELIRAFNAEAQDGDSVVAAAGGPVGNLLKLWDTAGGAACHLEFGFSCMGWEMPAALGVRMEQPDGEVYVYLGDGNYLLNPMELMTALQEDLKITVVVADNHGYQVIRRLQMARAGHSFGTEFRARAGGADGRRLDGDYLAVDMAAIAEAMGARGFRCATPDEVRAALREARGERRSCVIVAEIEKHRYVPGAGAWWDVAPAEVSRSEVTQTLRSEYERDRAALQRYHR